MRSTAKLSRSARLISVLLGAALLAWQAHAAPAIVLASTTSVEDSGLLGRILPLFTKATGIEVRVVAQGTGQALETARRGDADLVLVHDPEAEQKFISEGYGIDRRQIAWNDFVIVGPDNDPARIKGGHDAIAAFNAVAAAKTPFVSRCGSGRAPGSIRKKAQETGTATSAAAWARRSTPLPRCRPILSPIAARGS